MFRGPSGLPETPLSGVGRDTRACPWRPPPPPVRARRDAGCSRALASGRLRPGSCRAGEFRLLCPAAAPGSVTGDPTWRIASGPPKETGAACACGAGLGLPKSSTVVCARTRGSLEWSNNRGPPRRIILPPPGAHAGKRCRTHSAAPGIPEECPERHCPRRECGTQLGPASGFAWEGSAPTFFPSFAVLNSLSEPRLAATADPLASLVLAPQAGVLLHLF